MVDFAETLRSAHSNARRFTAPRFSAARIVVVVYNLLRKNRFPPQTACAHICGRFCGTFFAAPARFFTSAQVVAPSRPAKGSSPFDPRQGAPCTCPASPLMAKQGLCFKRSLAEEKSRKSFLFFRETEKRNGYIRRNRCHALPRRQKTAGVSKLRRYG